MTYKLIWKVHLKDYFSLLSGRLKAFSLSDGGSGSCDDKWGLPKLTGNSRVILSAFQRENTTLGVSRDRQKLSPPRLLPLHHAWNIYEIYIWERMLEVTICICWRQNYLYIYIYIFFFYFFFRINLGISYCNLSEAIFPQSSFDK